MPITVNIKEIELWDHKNERFIRVKPCTLTLEHSLLSISKWESIWHKPFLSQTEKKTNEELVSYIKCMTISPRDVDDKVYQFMPRENLREIEAYISDPMSATKINNSKVKDNHKNKDTVTSELIYYWMMTANIPTECEKWHINRLFNLINIYGRKNAPPKKMTRNDYSERSALNAARLKAHNSRG